MLSFLRKSTASQARGLGPFISDSDFKTVQTGLTINASDVKIVMNGGASANKNSGGGTHRANGNYGFTFNATDTATVGEMDVSILVTGALVVVGKFWVLEAAAYDLLFASGALGYVANAPVNVAQWGAVNVWPLYRLTLQSGSTGTTAVLPNGTADSIVRPGDWLLQVTGTAAGQSIEVASTANMGSATPVATSLTGQSWTPPAAGVEVVVFKKGGTVSGLASDFWSASSRTLSSDGYQAIFNVALSESYAALGAAPTAAQLLMFMQDRKSVV